MSDQVQGMFVVAVSFMLGIFTGSMFVLSVFGICVFGKLKAIDTLSEQNMERIEEWRVSTDTLDVVLESLKYEPESVEYYKWYANISDEKKDLLEAYHKKESE